MILSLASSFGWSGLFSSSLTLSLSLSLSFAWSGHVTQITFSLAVGHQTPPLFPKDRPPLQPELEGKGMMILPSGEGGPISEAQKARRTFLTCTNIGA